VLQLTHIKFHIICIFITGLNSNCTQISYERRRPLTSSLATRAYSITAGERCGSHTYKVIRQLVLNISAGFLFTSPVISRSVPAGWASPCDWFPPQSCGFPPFLLLNDFKYQMSANLSMNPVTTLLQM